MHCNSIETLKKNAIYCARRAILATALTGARFLPAARELLAHDLTHDGLPLAAVPLAGDVAEHDFALAHPAGARLTRQAAAGAGGIRDRVSGRARTVRATNLTLATPHNTVLIFKPRLTAACPLGPGAFECRWSSLISRSVTRC